MRVTLFAMLLAGCVLPAKLPNDLADNYTCVQQGVVAHLSALQIEAQCLPGQLQTVLDIVGSLLGSAQWRAAHPDLVPVAEGVQVEARARLMAGER
jgi:hypothetical protein